MKNKRKGEAMSEALTVTGPRERLEAYRQKANVGLREISAKLGCSASTLSRYINGVMEGDVVGLEACVEDFLRQEQRKQVFNMAPFESYATQVAHATFEQIRKTRDVGLVCGPAGVGKSVAVAMYQRDNPTAVAIEVPVWRGSEHGVARMIFENVETRGWKGRESVSVFLARRFAGSGRLILVDNAHRLRRGGLQWLFDFHDATECPIGLVGNPEVLDTIRANDQMHSRIGIKRELCKDRKGKERLDWLADAADKVIAALWPAAGASVRTLARESVLERGHLRALKKRIILAMDLLQTSKFREKDVEAFVEARHMMVWTEEE